MLQNLHIVMTWWRQSFFFFKFVLCYKKTDTRETAADCPRSKLEEIKAEHLIT